MRHILWLTLILVTTVTLGDQTTPPDAPSDSSDALTPQQRVDLANHRLADHEAADKQQETAALPSGTVLTGSEAQLKHDEAVQLAKAKYDVVLQKGHIEYFESVLAADDKLVADLSTALADREAAEKQGAVAPLAGRTELTGSGAQHKHDEAVELATARYDVVSQQGRIEYFRSLLVADDGLIAELSTAITAAMQNQNLNIAEQLDSEKAVATRLRELHHGIGNNLPKAQIVHAIWVADYAWSGSRPSDATSKLQEIVAKGQRDISANASAFGDPAPRVPKHLLIAVTIDAKSKTISVSEGEQLPDVLFPPVFQPDDPAAIP